MDDRSEKIVSLAREIMHKPEAAMLRQGHYNLTTVVLAAMLGAASAGTGTAILAEHYRPLNHYEKIELKALIHYVAQMRRINRAVLKAEFLTQFGIHSLNELTHAQMQAARNYLQKHLH